MRYNNDILSPYDSGYVLSYDRVIGAIRLRQVRGQWQSCQFLPDGLRLYPCFNQETFEEVMYKVGNRSRHSS